MDAVDLILAEAEKQRFERVRSKKGHDAVLLNDPKQIQNKLIQQLKQQKEKDLISILAHALAGRKDVHLTKLSDKVNEKIIVLRKIEEQAAAIKRERGSRWHENRESEPYRIFRHYQKMKAATTAAAKREAMKDYSQMGKEELKTLYEQVKTYDTGNTPLPNLHANNRKEILDWLETAITLKGK